MPLLVRLYSIHYSPKDSKKATQCLLIANDFDQALQYIDKEYLFDYFQSHEDSDETSHSLNEEWWEKNPDKQAEAETLGLKIEEYGYIVGSGENITRFLSSNDWKDADDAYYGVTHYDWSERFEISNEDVTTLLRLKLVEDIREWKSNEEVPSSDSATEDEEFAED